MLSTAFAALGEPTRLMIVDALLKSGEMNAGEISNLAEISQPAMSRHLKVLREARVVEQRVDRQMRKYRVNPIMIGEIRHWIEEARQFWEARFDRMDIELKKAIYQGDHQDE